MTFADRLSEARRVLIAAIALIPVSLSFLNNVFHSQRHTDIFDLVSGMQKEAINEEKLEKEKRRELKERKRVKERHAGREWEKEVDREKEKEDEVLCRRGLNDLEFHINMIL